MLWLSWEKCHFIAFLVPLVSNSLAFPCLGLGLTQAGHPDGIPVGAGDARGKVPGENAFKSRWATDAFGLCALLLLKSRGA